MTLFKNFKLRIDTNNTLEPFIQLELHLQLEDIEIEIKDIIKIISASSNPHTKDVAKMIKLTTQKIYILSQLDAPVYKV